MEEVANVVLEGVECLTGYKTNILYLKSSSQEGGVGRNASLPRTTKRRMTTNLKTINKKKCQKIKLHGTPTTKELKKH